MKRFLTASLAGLVLIASQASAALPNASLSPSDRAQAAAEGTTNEFRAMPLPVIILTIFIIGGFIWAVSESDDGPSSP